MGGTAAPAAAGKRSWEDARRLGAGRAPRLRTNPKLALVKETVLQQRALRRYRGWLVSRTFSPQQA
ncbi:hypothetical protein [Amycolatopsis sp. NPDC003676]